MNDIDKGEMGRVFEITIPSCNSLISVKIRSRGIEAACQYARQYARDHSLEVCGSVSVQEVADYEYVGEKWFLQ